MDNQSENKLSAKIMSAAADCYSRSRPYFTRFLTPAEQAQIKKLCLPSGVFGVFYGGDKNTEPDRCCFGIIPNDFGLDENTATGLFEIKTVCFKYRLCDELSHRDILGSLMALGIERDTIGDIYVMKGMAVVYAAEKMADYIAGNITKIGKVGVTAVTDADFTLPKRQYEEIFSSVASLRLDNVVKSVAGCSRGNAVERLIRPGLVTLNSITSDDPSKTVNEGDVISVRGKGKFLLYHIGDTGRKGNIHITIKKYI